MHLDRGIRLGLAVLFLSAFVAAPSRAHNVTQLLENYAGFSIFNNYLTLTHLDVDINSRNSITVLAVDNAAMSDLLATKASLGTIKNILSLHVLLDYFGARKIHQLSEGSALASTLFQASGSAPGATGMVNLTDLKGGKVALGPNDNKGVLDVYFVKSLEEVPYNISVLQVSKIIPSAEAAVPAPDPATMNLTALMAGHGCTEFANTISASPDILSTFKDAVVGGLTVFCPSDGSFKAFRPKLGRLSAADRASFLQFYGVPVYMSMAMLRLSNGQTNTLATDGPKKFNLTIQNDGDAVTLKTNVNTVTLTGTVFDLQPLAIFATDGVLIPAELSMALAAAPAPVSSPAPAVAPSPGRAADTPATTPAPKPPKHMAPPVPESDDSPAEAPDADADEHTADSKATKLGFESGRHYVVVLGLIFGAIL